MLKKLCIFVVLFGIAIMVYTKIETEGDKKQETVETYTVKEDMPTVEYNFSDRDRFYSDLSAVMKDRPSKLCVKGKPLKNMEDFYQTDYGCFWLESFRYQLEHEGTVTYTYITPKYYELNDAEITKMKGEIDLAADQILSQIPNGADDWTKALIIHDELCKRITYDQSLELAHTHDLYGALVNNEAVCSAYSSAFFFLLNRLGIKSDASYSDVHAWNGLRVPSAEAYIDSTWDDTDYYDAYGRPYIVHDHFFLTFEEVKNIDSHSYESLEPGQLILSDPLFYNYHKHEGYYLDYYDTDQIANIFYRQFLNNSNVLTVRFSSYSAYATAKQWMDERNGELNDILTRIGYIGSYYYWPNDDINVMNILLYAE